MPIAARAASPPAPTCNLRSLGLAPHPAASHATVWSGFVPSWDGIPLDVDVTVPAQTCHVPLIVFGHGWGGDKAAWEKASGPNQTGWNSAWFAGEGMASLNFTMRGWHGSCGPAAAAGGVPAGLPAACTANGRQYWVHLDDMRYEIRDAQWLIGRLADTGLVDPARIVATGGSYGGGQTDLLALLGDRVMCGGAAALPPDPCRGVGDGGLVPWRSPHGVALHIAAAVPEYTWASLANALVPNGRAAATVTDQAALEAPIGTPIESYVTGLYADAYEPPAVENGFLQPPTSTDQTADLPLWFAETQAGVNSASATIAGPILEELADYKSPLTRLVKPDRPIPMLQIQGLTDPLFRPVEALMLRTRLVAAGWPVTTDLGDVGHSYADNPADVWAKFNADANAFIDRVVTGRGPGLAPGVLAIVTRCRGQGPLVSYAAPSWAALQGPPVVFASSTGGVTTNAAAGQVGVHTDPIVNGGGPAALPGTGKGCPVLAALGNDPGTIAWTWPVRRSVTLMGSPVVRAAVTLAGVDAELDGRLWDVAPDGSAALIARGTYRVVAGGVTRLELSANAWQLAAGHQLRLELAGADAPYYQPDSLPSTMVIGAVRVEVPTARP